MRVFKKNHSYNESFKAGPGECGLFRGWELQAERVAAREPSMNRGRAVVAAVAYAPEWKSTARAGGCAIPLQDADAQRVHGLLETLA